MNQSEQKRKIKKSMNRWKKNQKVIWNNVNINPNKNMIKWRKN